MNLGNSKEFRNLNTNFPNFSKFSKFSLVKSNLSNSDNENKPPFDKGRFGGNVNIGGSPPLY